MPISPPLTPSFIAALHDAVLLNRAVYGTDDYFQSQFRDDYDPARDPDSAGNRSALAVYDRYDQYLDQFGFKTLSSAEIGFSADEIRAAEESDGLDRNFTYAGDLYRNNFQQLSDGTSASYPQAGAVAIAALKESDDGKTLHLAFRGTDADLGADGEAGSGPGQVRYYQQLKSLIDKALAYISDPGNGVTKVVVSGHSLGGAMADMFALYDGAAFAAVEGVALQVVALASAGIDPATLELKPGYDPSLVNVGEAGITFNTPDWYSQYDHAEDIVRNPERYDETRHAQEDPTQAPITRGATGTLVEHIHFADARISFEAPLIDQYEISKNFQTNFLSQHYADFYELTGTGFAAAARYAKDLDYDRFIALFGTNDRLDGTPGDNNVNGWGVPVDNTISFSDETDSLFVIGLSGRDKITGGTGDDLLAGGRHADVLDGGAGADILVGGSGSDALTYSRATGRVVAYLDGRTGGAGATGDRAFEIEDLVGSGFGDRLQGSTAANEIHGRSGKDEIHGAGGEDILFGGSGADIVLGGGDRDFLFAGSGDDHLDGNSAADRLFGRSGEDELSGSGGDDRIFGGGNSDVVKGGSGQDLVAGGSGRDRVKGGEGRDTVSGGTGSDDLWGGAGRDTFQFRDDSGRDRVRDFNNGADRFDLSDVQKVDGFSDLEIRKIGDGVLIDYASGSFVVEDTAVSRIGASDFLFG